MLTRALAISLAVSVAANGLLGWGVLAANRAVGEKNAALKVASAQLHAVADRLREYQGAADAGFADLKAACAANSRAAVTAGRAIERIIHAPANPAGPAGIIGAGELRDVAGQPAAAAVPAGREDGGDG